MVDFKNGFIAGNISGMGQIFVGHPLDTLKTRLQNKKPCIYPIKSILHTQKPIPSLYGLKHLYKGIRYPLFSSILQNGIVFGSNTYFQNISNNHWYTGFISGCLVSFVVSPSDYCKIQEQTSNSFLTWKNVKPSLHTISKFYRGFHLTLLRESISFSIYFGSANHLQVYYNQGCFISGGIAGILCWLLTYPIDTIKTRYQSGLVSSSWEAIQLSNLWKGVGYCVIRGGLVNSVGWWLYDKSLFYLS